MVIRTTSDAEKPHIKRAVIDRVKMDIENVPAKKSRTKKSAPKKAENQGKAPAANLADSRFLTEKKERVTIWLDKKVVDHFRSTGPGWQPRMNAVLEGYIRDKVS